MIWPARRSAAVRDDQAGDIGPGEEALPEDALGLDVEGAGEIISKDEIKEYLGRSPDLADMIAMKTVFELDKASEPTEWLL